MTDFRLVPPHRDVRITFDESPALNSLCSFCLLGQEVSGIASWVTRTEKELPEAQLKRNKLLCGIHQHISPDTKLEFPNWLDEFASRSVDRIRTTELDSIRLQIRTYLGARSDLDPADIMSSFDSYLAFKRLIWGTVKGESGTPEMEEELREEWQITSDPEGFRDLAVSHFRELWDRYLADEWKKSRTLIRDSVAAFRSLDLDSMTTMDAVRRVIDRDLIPELWMPWLETVQEVVFIPNPHIGPYLIMLNADERRICIAGRVRIPEGAAVLSPALSRSELLMRLGALADDTRLRILETIAHEGDKTTQEVMDSLGITQSSASRHLNQLAATGFLTTASSERQKRYHLSRDKIEQVFNALRAFLE